MIKALEAAGIPDEKIPMQSAIPVDFGDRTDVVKVGLFPKEFRDNLKIPADISNFRAKLDLQTDMQAVEQRLRDHVLRLHNSMVSA